MRCEQILCQNDCLYHQNKNGWLEWCSSNIFDIKQEFLERMNNNMSTQDFFGDWVNYKGYSDVGYYLGCEFVKHLQEKYTLIEIANLNIDELNNKFKQFLL